MYFLAEDMLQFCVDFNESQSMYVYKTYAYKKWLYQFWSHLFWEIKWNVSKTKKGDTVVNSIQKMPKNVFGTALHTYKMRNSK